MSVSLPGPAVAGPCRLRLALPGWTAFSYDLIDERGDVLGSTGRESRFGAGLAVAGDVRLDVRRDGKWRKRTVASDPETGAELISLGRRGEGSAASVDLVWERPPRLGPRPWRLVAEGSEIGRFRAHLFSRRRRVVVDLAAGDPVPVLLVLVACGAVVTTQADHVPPVP